jgi:peptidoglycan/LPS O-acetylase OafA/YrhL
MTTAVHSSPSLTQSSVAVQPEQTSASEPPRQSGKRLAWLDALRGLAALVVVYEHVGYHVLSDVRDVTDTWFSAGTFGVMLFFIVSGYIIPASLERKGSVRSFWISRIFRLYPLWITALVAVIALRATGLHPSDDYMRENVPTSLLGHATMLQDLLGVPNTVNVMWTLSYEMVFYLLVGGLFILGLHRFSAEIALLFAGTALLAGHLLPKMAISESPLQVTGTVMLTAVVLVAGLLAVVSGKRWPLIIGGIGLAVLALVLVTVNGRSGAWSGLTIPAFMFAGTAIYRAHAGQISNRKAWITSLAVLGMGISAGLYNPTLWGISADQVSVERWRWITALLLAAGLFGVGLLLRHRQMPRVLTWLGVISFSLYLLHPLFVEVFDSQLRRFGNDPLVVQLVVFMVFTALIALACTQTYRFIEAPFQRMGHRIGQRWEARVGSDAGLLPAARPERSEHVG